MRSKVISILVLLCLLVSAFGLLNVSPIYASDEVIVMNHEDSDSCVYTMMYVQGFMFIADGDYLLTSVSLEMCVLGETPPLELAGDITIKLEDVDSNHKNYSPFTALATATIPEATLEAINDSYPTMHWINAQFDTPYWVEDGEEYCIIVSIVDGGEEDHLYWRCEDNVGDYPGGTLSSTSATEVACTYNVDVDANFRLYAYSDATGYTTDTYTIDSADDNGWIDSDWGEDWIDVYRGGSSPEAFSDGTIRVGYEESANIIADCDWQISEGVLGFDVGSLPSGTIEQAYIEVYCEDKLNENGLPLAYTFRVGTNSNDTIEAGDFDNWTGCLSGVMAYNYVNVDDWNRFYLDIDEIELSGSGYLWTYLCVSYQYMGIQPADTCFSLQDKENYVLFEAYDGVNTHPPRLVLVSYSGSEEPEATHGTQGDPIAEIDDGVITSISWETLRCFYSNQDVWVDIVGTPGTPFIVEAVDGEGNMLDSLNSSIRDNNHYYWQVDIPVSTEGFVRIVETETSNVSSEWGYSAKPRVNMAPMSVYALNADVNNQWNKDISSFSVNATTPMIFHHSTNVDTNFLDDYDLVVYSRDATELSSINFADLQDDYYHGLEGNEAFISNCFSLYAVNLGSGEDYDGLLIDLGLSNDQDNLGFITCYVEDSGTAITNPNSAYFWTAGANPTLNYVNSVNSASVSITNAGPSNIFTDIPQGILAIYAGDTLKTSSSNFFSTEANNVSVDYGVQSTGLKARLSLSGNGDFTFNREWAYYPSGSSTGSGPGGSGGIIGTGGEFWGQLNDSIAEWGLDNQIGYWIITIVLMGIGFFVFKKSPALRVIAPLSVFGIAIIGGWIPIWVTLLLALGAGFTLFFYFRKVTQGG